MYQQTSIRIEDDPRWETWNNQPHDLDRLWFIIHSTTDWQQTHSLVFIDDWDWLEDATAAADDEDWCGWVWFELDVFIRLISVAPVALDDDDDVVDDEEEAGKTIFLVINVLLGPTMIRDCLEAWLLDEPLPFSNGEVGDPDELWRFKEWRLLEAGGVVTGTCSDRSSPPFPFATLERDDFIER